MIDIQFLINTLELYVIHRIKNLNKKIPLYQKRTPVFDTHCQLNNSLLNNTAIKKI